MMSFMILGSGTFIFLAAYLSFDYWYERYWGRILKVKDKTKLIYEDLFVYKSDQVVLNEMILWALVPTLMMFYLFWPTFYVAVPASVFTFYHAVKLPGIVLEKYYKKKRVSQFSVQMIDALTLMGNGLRSGLNIPQTLQIVVDEMPAPVSQEFGLVLNENRVGVTLEKAFDNMARRIDTEDVNMFTTSVNILRETGGNIAETFDTIVKTIRERLKLQSKIKAMTAQGMTSAIMVGGMPWVMGMAMYFIDPVMVRPLFTTLFGAAILLVIITLEAIGFFLILKMIKIRV